MPKGNSGVRFKSCSKGNGNSISFFNFTESLLGKGVEKRPFHRICEVMRKAAVKSLSVHRNIQDLEEFKENFSHLNEYLDDIQGVAELQEVIQVSFFSKNIPENARKLPERITDSDVLGTCVITKLVIKTNIGRYKKDMRVGFVYEAVLAIPTVVLNDKRVKLLNSSCCGKQQKR